MDYHLSFSVTKQAFAFNMFLLPTARHMKLLSYVFLIRFLHRKKLLGLPSFTITTYVKFLGSVYAQFV